MDHKFHVTASDSEEINHGLGAKLYEAYHIINHYNLFGGGYLYQGVGLLEALL